MAKIRIIKKNNDCSMEYEVGDICEVTGTWYGGVHINGRSGIPVSLDKEEYMELNTEPEEPDSSVKECLYASMTHSFTSLSALLIAYQYSAGNSSISSHLNTGPSLQTYLEPILQRPHLPIPHFIRSSRVV